MKTDVTSHRSLIVAACWGLAMLLAAASSQRARGQLLQGAIDGNVTDASQAAVAGAKVVATDQATNLVRDTTTSSAGVYNLTALPPGTYAVTVSAPSFQTYTRTGVVVTVQTVTRVDVSMSVGQVNQNVTVSAQTATLQADRADVRSELSGHKFRGEEFQLMLRAVIDRQLGLAALSRETDC